jgi:hypothetical protein
MRTVLAAVTILAGCCAVQAQEALSREEALKAAFRLCSDLPKMLDTPIPTDPDVKRPVGVHADNRGLLILPEAKLGLDAVAKAGPDAVSVGQLWLLKIVPVAEGRPVKADRLRIVNVSGEKENASVAQCALGVRKGADGRPELLVYGKDKEPLLHVALTQISEKKQENPIEVSAEQQGDGAMLTLKILGKFSASFPVGTSE